MARILHVLTSPRAEGTPRLVLDWLSVGAHEQEVVFLTSEPPDLLGEFQSTGCTLHCGAALVRGPGKFPRIINLARRHVRAFKPDVVIAWPTGFSHWIFLGARLAGSRARLLSHAGNPPESGFYGRCVMTWICFWTTALCGGRVVACSRYVQREYQKIPLVPKFVVRFAYNSVRTAAIARRAEAARVTRPAGGPFRAIMVATLESHKDHATLIRAARLLRDRSVQIEIRLAGAGRLEAELRSLAHDLGVSDTVQFLGARQDVPELLGQSDCFVLSTTSKEGRPGVLLEAMSADLPIVATDVLPVRELLEDGAWGTLVAAGDPDCLAVELSKVADQRTSDPRTFGRRAFAGQFTPERMCADYLACLNRAKVSSRK